MTKSVNTFYSKLPKDISTDAAELQEFCETYPDGVDVTMKFYFGKHWDEFQKFWKHEQILWTTFALAPHNARWFVEWVFYHYPETRTKIMTDLHNAKAS